MKKAWPSQSIAAICEVVNGGTPKTGVAEYWGGEHQWITPAEMGKRSSPFVSETDRTLTDQGLANSSASPMPPYSVILSSRAPIGHLVINTVPMATNQGCKGLVPGKAINYKFLYYYLGSIVDLLNALGTGATFRELSGGKLKEVTIPVPPLPEQRRIVGILDEAFEGIATAKTNAEKNLQNARALYESGLDSATNGRLTRDWRRDHPATEDAAAHLTGRLAERRSRWKGAGRYHEPHGPISTTPIDIPKTWVLGSPEQVTTHIVDCPHSTPKWSKFGVLCLRTTNFKPGYLDLESVQFVTEQTYKERILRLEPRPDDVLYSREGGILGIACIIPAQLKTCLGQRMMLFRLDSSLALPEYFTAVLNSTLILSEVRRLTGGAAAPHLNIRDIRTFPIPLPPIPEQHQIVSKLKTISSQTQRLELIYQKKLAALEALKKSLLHRAFTGEL